jgi:prepilin-type N-terminal cleavage/methylation domain-containing protein/prepilin-type processing-associated H-X9-DG protein
MIKRKGFTLVELLVVIAIIALLMGILLPALAKARELGKRAVCMNQIKSLGVGWYLYCDDNKERVPVGDVWYSWSGNCTPAVAQLSWHEWPHPYPHNPAGPPSVASNQTNAYPLACTQCKQADWWHATEEGTMWRYVKDHKAYKCPVGNKGQEITYAMLHSMNTDVSSCYIDGSAAKGPGPRVVLRTDIKRTAERAVFLDAGYAKQGAFYVRYNTDASNNHRWSDTPPTRHGLGTNFVFADQHVEYKKWADAHAIEATKHEWDGRNWAGADDKCDCDLRWFVKVTWGNVPYTCATGKRCDY